MSVEARPKKVVARRREREVCVLDKSKPRQCDAHFHRGIVVSCSVHKYQQKGEERKGGGGERRDEGSSRPSIGICVVFAYVLRAEIIKVMSISLFVVASSHSLRFSPILTSRKIMDRGGTYG